jgi:NTE family protein
MTREERPGERLALVLGGGGTLGAAEVGFIRRIAELGIAVDMVIGTSVGALNAGHVVFHEDPGHDCLREIWRELEGKPLFHRSIPRIAFNLLRTRMSLYDDSFVRRLVSAHLPEDDFRAARIPLFITAANLRTGKRHIFSEGSVLDAVLASTAVPGLLPPVRIGDDLFVDGAVTNPTDIDAAIELGATQIIAIDLSPGLDERMPSNIMEVILRSYAVLAEFRSTCVVEHAEHRADVVHIRPGLQTESSSRLGDVEGLIEHSYSMACSVFDQCWDGEQLHPGSYQLAVSRAG